MKNYYTSILGNLLALGLLKADNLTQKDEQLVKATIRELNYEIVKSKLTEVVSDESIPPDVKSEIHINSEPTFHTSKSYNKIPDTLPVP